jgi:hypothetical protein
MAAATASGGRPVPVLALPRRGAADPVAGNPAIVNRIAQA